MVAGVGTLQPPKPALYLKTTSLADPPTGVLNSQPIAILESDHWCLLGVLGAGRGSQSFPGTSTGLSLAACFPSETPAGGAAEPSALFGFFMPIPGIHLDIISSPT